MHFRSQKKLQGEVSLADTLEAAGDGGSLSLMDVIAVDDDMLEQLDTRDACRKVRECVNQCLSPREKLVITLRYGLDDRAPRTQREIAAQCGISRSYVSRRGYCKRRPESLVGQDFRGCKKITKPLETRRAYCKRQNTQKSEWLFVKITNTAENTNILQL